MRRQLALIPACLVLLTCHAWSANRAEVEGVFRQGANHYEGCKIISRWNSVVTRKSGTVNGSRVVFGDLRFPGEDVKIASAEVRLTFAEEGFSVIPNADLEIYDGAEKGGKPLDVVKYRGHKVVGMDAKTRVVAWKVPAVLVRRWVAKPKSNQGIRFKVTPDREGGFQMIFRLNAHSVLRNRPTLSVAYSFSGNAAPFGPEIATKVAGKTFGPRFTAAWLRKRWDPAGTPVVYEVAIAPKGRPALVVRSVDAEKLACDLDTLKLPTGDGYQLKMRAVDPEGLNSEWVTAEGEFRVTRKECVVWTQNSVTKVQREENPPEASAPAKLAAARNEYESLQVVVSALSNLKDVDVAVGDLAGPGGAKIAKDAFQLFRVHYVNCQGQGWLPDSMVPWRDPWSKKRIGGKFGAPFEVAGGANAVVWAELHVPADAAPGKYCGRVEVTVSGKPAASVPIHVTVWPVTMPKTTTLLTYFRLSDDTPKRHALQALHEHRMDVWAISHLGHKLKWVDGKPVMRWSAERDGAVDDYFSGVLFEDGVPGKSLFVSQSWAIRQVLRGKSDENRIAILKQYEAHYKDKPYVNRMAWFFIDEPNAKTLAKCVRVGRQIKEHSPSLKFLLTTRYNKDLVGLVDIWDAIINNEVVNWNAPGPDPYRDEMSKGRMAINCITVNSNTATSPNTFIHHKAMNTRIWTWVTYCLDQQGIELWDTRAAPSVLVPKAFGGNVWGDGSLFYRGLKEELPIHEREIALASIRLKILRDAIEDFELLTMLAKKDRALAKKLCRRMVQETKQYDKSFAAPVQHVSWNWNRDGKGDRKVPGFIVWESSEKRLAETRAAIAAAIAEHQ